MPRPRFFKLDAARRRTILDAAREEFARSGFDNASYNQIIQGAGLSKGAMYYYFDDKLDLYVTVLEEVNAEMMAAMGLAEPAAFEADFWRAFADMSKRAMQFVLAHPDIAALAKPIAGFPRRQRKEGRLGELYAQWTALLRGLFELGQKQGAVRCDLPMDLLLEVAVSLDEAFDFWVFEHVDELRAGEGEAGFERIVDVAVDLWRRVLAP